MSPSINTNIFALQSQRSISKTLHDVNKASERLASGKRINRPSDDPSGLQMVAMEEADARGYTVAMRNINDGISMVNIADGGLETSSSTLMRMQELAVQASNGTLSDDQRASLDAEYQALKAELDRTQETMEFNGQPVAGSSTTIQSGIDSDAGSQTTINVPSVGSSSLGVAADNLLTADSARTALTNTKNAIESVASARGELGAAETRLSTQYSNISEQRLLVTQSMSTKLDADIATESANLVAAKISLQGNISLSAQANLQPQQILKLLG